MKIGVTERGDAALDLTWAHRLDEVDGAILITKDCSKQGFQDMLQIAKKPIILHATCTGMGRTKLEPNVPSCAVQLLSIQEIIRKGLLPAKNIVIRIDPIYPYDTFYVNQVLNYIGITFTTEEKRAMRYRISVMDFYPHTKERLVEAGFEVPDGFQAPAYLFKSISNLLSHYSWLTFETCAEDRLIGPNIKHTGCVSIEDIKRMGLKAKEDLNVNPQGRSGCLCLSCKTELLNNKYRCPHKCLYCYWKDAPKKENK